MKILDTSEFTKEIHFPTVQAIYKKPPKRTWYQKILKFLTYRRWFEVQNDYVLWIPLLDSYIFIPASFVFDGASVPKVLNGLFNTNGILLLGALPHDFGYRYNGLLRIAEETGSLYFKKFSKNELDRIFGNLCAWESEFPKASFVAEKTLSLFGFLGWKENRNANNILSDDFPSIFAELEENHEG